MIDENNAHLYPANPAFAEGTTYGIGASVMGYGFEGGGMGIYFPINQGNLLIEPYLNMSNSMDEYSSVTGTTRYEYENQATVCSILLRYAF